MILIRVGSRRLNLCYLIMDEHGDGTPEMAHVPLGEVQVRMVPGIVFTLKGADAEQYRRQVDPFLEDDPGGRVAIPPAPVVREIDPGSGLPRAASKPARTPRKRRK